MKKHYVACRILLITLLVLCISMITACGGSPKPDVTITLDGKELIMDETLQTSLDNGLITADHSGEEESLSIIYGAKEVRYDYIHLGTSSVPHDSAVSVMLYNPSSSEKSVYECKIMTLNYFVDIDNSDQAPVTINGIDFWGMTQDEAVAALQEQGFEVNTDSMEQYHFATCAGNKSTWITLDFDPGASFTNESPSNPQKKVLDFEADTYYVSGVKVDISSKLNISFE